MQVKHETRNALSAGMKIIPAWAWTLAAVGFASAEVFFNLVMRDTPVWAPVLMGLLAGTVLVCYFLLVGYVSRDAGRRGMSSLLWTVVAIVIPNGLGIILYFILRQPLRRSCPQCGNAVQPEFNFCPSCNCKLSPNCPQCQRVVGVNDVYCPYCGTSLRTQVVTDAVVAS